MGQCVQLGDLLRRLPRRLSGSRTVSFVVNDGTFNSAAATKTVDRHGDPSPVITTDSGSANFLDQQQRRERAFDARD
jgi:hypothetical protein